MSFPESRIQGLVIGRSNEFISGGVYQTSSKVLRNHPIYRNPPILEVILSPEKGNVLLFYPLEVRPIGEF